MESKSEQKREDIQKEAIERDVKNGVTTAPQVQAPKPKFRYYHDVCSNTAFLALRLPKGTLVEISDFVRTDGTPYPVPEGDFLTIPCCSCLYQSNKP